MSALSFAAFMAELTLGWAATHPGPVILGTGIAGVAAVAGIATVINRRDDMPLSFTDQEILDTITAIGRPEEIHHEPARVPARPGRGRHEAPAAWPRLPRATGPGRHAAPLEPARVLAPAAFLTAPLARHELPALPPAGGGDGQASPAAVTPTDVPGRPEGGDTATSTAAASVPHTHGAAENPSGPAGNTALPCDWCPNAATCAPAGRCLEPRPAGDTGADEESIWPHDTSWYSLPAMDAAIAAGELRDRARAGAL